MSLWLRTGGDLSIELVNVLPIFVNLIRRCLPGWGTTLAATVSNHVLWSFQSASHSPTDLRVSKLKRRRSAAVTVLRRPAIGPTLSS